jgi:hypothetical protein
LSAKHSAVFPLRRHGFIAAAATLLILLVSWVAVRAVGPARQDDRTPLMVQPTIPIGEAAPSVIPWGDPPSPASVDLEPVASASPSASRSRTAAPTKPAAKATTTKPAPRRTTKPAPPPAAFSARYSVSSSWDHGFVSSVQVTNTGGTAGNWSVTVTFDSRARVRINNAWNAQLARQGDSNVFTGGPLAPGASVTFGFDASKRTWRRVQPTGCTINGTPCRLG